MRQWEIWTTPLLLALVAVGAHFRWPLVMGLGITLLIVVWATALETAYREKQATAQAWRDHAFAVIVNELRTHTTELRGITERLDAALPVMGVSLEAHRAAKAAEREASLAAFRERIDTATMGRIEELVRAGDTANAVQEVGKATGCDLIEAFGFVDKLNSETNPWA